MSKKAYQNKEYIRNKNVVHWLYNGKCFVPNCDRDSEETHHVDKNNENNSIFNLIPLCQIDHKLIEKSSGNITNVAKSHLKMLIAKINEWIPKSISSAN